MFVIEVVLIRTDNNTIVELFTATIVAILYSVILFVCNFTYIVSQFPITEDYFSVIFVIYADYFTFVCYYVSYIFHAD